MIDFINILMIFLVFYEIISNGGESVKNWFNKFLGFICFGSLIAFALSTVGIIDVLTGLGNIFLITSIVSVIMMIGNSVYQKNKKIKNEMKLKRQLDEKALSYFNEHEEMLLNEKIRIRSNQAKGFDDLDVYYGDEKLCKVREFKKTFLDTYDYFKYVLFTNEHEEQVEGGMFEEEDTINLTRFMLSIDEMNRTIPHNKITEDLYHTSSMIKFIHQILEQYPDKQSKVSKLNYYYLPTLVSILKNYARLSGTNKTDPDFIEVEDQLVKTVYLVNQALETMSQNLCDDEILDLSSDMSVLETMLKRDGLVREGTIDELKGRGKDGG